MGPGDLVVCIADGWHPEGPNDPKHGVVYTIRDSAFDPAKGKGWRLHEIINAPDSAPYGELAFHVSGFRPVNPNRIQVFRSLLVNPRKRIEVEA